MSQPQILDAHGHPLEPKAFGGAYEGSSRHSRELALWTPPVRSADGDMTGQKEILNARSYDLKRNDGYINGAVATHKDSIVGSHFKLNARPNIKSLGLDEGWAKEFQEVAESEFTLYAESTNCWVDAARVNTLTSMIRLVVGTYALGGESLATAEWIRKNSRPYNTAIQLVDPDRLSNPNNISDTEKLRGGVLRDHYGERKTYYVRTNHPGDHYNRVQRRWKPVPVRKPWGRLQVIHNMEQLRIDQTRGVGDMVSILKEMKMTKKFQDITLQNAVVNATYAAAIESELPSAEAYETLGFKNGSDWAEDYLTQIAEYTGNSKNMHIDGVKIPHLYPGTKLNLLSPGDPGGVGSEFEQSLLRHVAAGLGLSYEQFSRDYTQTNYSSARASMGETFKFMQSRKKIVADNFASHVYALWLEEAIAKGTVPLPRNAPNFYEGLNKEAYAGCSWIGASRGQIDELKETQAAALRIRYNLSTLEKECGRFGEDYRDVLTQRAREKTLLDDLGLEEQLDKTSVSMEDDESDRRNDQSK